MNPNQVLLSDASHQPNQLIEDNLFYMLTFSLHYNIAHASAPDNFLSIQHEVLDKVNFDQTI